MTSIQTYYYGPTESLRNRSAFPHVEESKCSCCGPFLAYKSDGTMSEHGTMDEAVAALGDNK